MIDSIVLKVAAPCNLRCTYCYEYQTGDTSWQQMPKHLGPGTARQLGLRIREYATDRNLSRFQVIFHGGEPLLLSRSKLESVIAALREAAAPVELRLGMQTNGVLIDEGTVSLVRENCVRVGVSLDGNAGQNRRRVDLTGRPTFERALAGYRRLQNSAPEFLSGILTVIDLDNDPASTVGFLCSLQPRQLDLLLPFETHDSLGPHRAEWSARLDDWLQRASDAWLRNPEYSKVKIRIFEDAMQAAITRHPRTDWFGPRRLSYLLVATSGDIDTLDHLKVIGENSSQFRDTAANLFDHTLAEAEAAALNLLERFGASTLPTGCSACSLRDVCAGGYLPHRYSTATVFDNPSVACAAIQGMFSRFLPIMQSRLDFASRISPKVAP
jgi:uncharacterized protein